MYQAERHGTAIGFLKDACVLGVKALDTWKRESSVNGDGERKGEKAGEGWRQLEEQLYRRWELLGVCYSKIGDRRVSFSIFTYLTCKLIHV
jgi:separase